MSGGGPAAEEDILPYLRVLSSERDDVSERGAQILILRSRTNPGLIVGHFPEIKLLVTSLCHARNIRWGTVSSIVLAVAQALISDQGSMAACVLDVFEISRIITKAYFLRAVGEPGFMPILRPFGQVLELGFSSGNLKMNIELVLAFSDHCCIGFTPPASMADFFQQRLQEVAAIMVTCDPSCYERLARPISSPARHIGRVFVALWSLVIADLMCRPLVVAAVARHSEALLELASESGKEVDVSLAAEFILHCLKATPREVPDLQKSAREVSKIVMEKFRIFLMRQAKERAGRTHSEGGARRSVGQVTLKRTMSAGSSTGDGRSEPFGLVIDDGVYRCSVELRKAKKKISKRELVFCPDAKVVMWPKMGKDVKEGQAFHLSELGDVKSLQVKQKDNIEYVLRLIPKKGDPVEVAFKNMEVARSWSGLIKEAMRTSK
jgi:hypothetical protein